MVEQEKQRTGYPHIDRPWLRYYSEEAINAPLPDGSLYDYMTECNKGRLDCVALNYFGTKITHCQFLRRIEECAGALVARGVKQGDIVSVCMLTMPEVLVLLYAINYIGAVCNFLVLNTTVPELKKQLQQTQSRLVFTVDLAADRVKQATEDTIVAEIVSIPLAMSMPPLTATVVGWKNRKQPKTEGLTHWKQFLKDGRTTKPVQAMVRSHDLALLEYTSGTTGESKGTMLSNQAVNTVPFHYMNSSTVFEFHSGEKFLCIVPPFLSVGLVTTLLMPLCTGFELILEPDSDPAKTAKNVIKYRPNHLCGGPLHVNNLVSDPLIAKMNLSFLSTVAYGGEKSDPHWEQDVSKFLFAHGMNHELVNGYGLSETAASFCTSTHKTNFMIPFVKNNILIRDVDTDEVLRYGKEGEICVSGPSIMLGYYKRPDATDDLMFEQDGVRWMRTGDLGMVTEDGAFHITGRLKRILWAVGEDDIVFRVYPMQIEAVICECPGAAQCGVVGLPNEKQGYLCVAFVVPKNQDADRDVLRQDILALTRQKLNLASQPHTIHFVDSLPTTRAGKIDFKALEKRAAEWEDF